LQTRFGIELDPDRVQFVTLKKRRWVEESSWPRLTLLGQSIGSVVLAYEALSAFLPDVFVGKGQVPFTVTTCIDQPCG
jgi:alpha-1,2-mannosyltransferase